MDAGKEEEENRPCLDVLALDKLIPTPVAVELPVTEALEWVARLAFRILASIAFFGQDPKKRSEIRVAALGCGFNRPASRSVTFLAVVR